MANSTEIVAELIALWSVGFVMISLIFKPELEPNFLIKIIELIACLFTIIIFGNKLLKEILDYIKLKGGKK